MHWKRANYILHRWAGIVLGLIVLVWFVSGIAMMYYPYPELTAREQLNAFPPLALDRAPPLIDFAAARLALVNGVPGTRPPSSARLVRWDGRPVYQLYADHGSHHEGVGLVDAVDGTLLSPLSPELALRSARAAGPFAGLSARVELLPRGDHYFMGNEMKDAYPVYRVRFTDGQQTAIYVTSRTGQRVATIDWRGRLLTWIGSVPHWLYFQGLYYDHFSAWLWISILVPGASMALALTGVVLGLLQLFPRRRRREWRLSSYGGVSKWHHVAGVVFGVLVFTWTLSGMLEVLGPSPSPSGAVRARARGDSAAWREPTLNVQAAVARVAATTRGATLVAVDLTQSGGRAGYLAHLSSGGRVWVDAATGSLRREIDSEAAIRVAREVASLAVDVAAAERRSEADAFYYATHGRDLTLPAWRVRFRDAAHTSVYLDPVSGMPTALIDDDVRRWRWWRDGLHDFDFPALVNQRPLWDAVVLPLMLGGVLSCVTGVWLLGRRLWRWRPGR